MFSYDEADITYSVMWGKLDGSSDIDYTYDLNQKEARIYTKARMLGQDLDEVMDTYRIEREIIRYERSEYGSDIRDARVSIWFCYNQEQPPEEDVKEYLTDLLKAHKYELAHDVVETQINVFEDIENDWIQIALDLAAELHCPGYIKKYKDEVHKKVDNKKPLLEPISEKLKDALDNFRSYYSKIRKVLDSYDSYGGAYSYSDGFYYVVTKMVEGKKREGVIGHTGDLLLPCKFAFLHPSITEKRRIGKVEHSILDIFIFQEEEKGLYGLIKIDGTIVLKPSFGIIDHYDFEHNLIVVGEDRKHVGVFSLDLHKFIVPCKYDYISTWGDCIYCSCNSRSVESWHDTSDLTFYDFDGNLIKEELNHRRV